MVSEEKLIKIGRTVKPHGLKGYVKMHLYCNDVDYDVVYIDEHKLKIEKLNILPNNKSIIKFVNLDDINDIERFCKKDVMTNRKTLMNNEIYYEDLVGMVIMNYHNEEVAIVRDVCDFGAGLLLDTDLDFMISWNQVEKFDKKLNAIILKADALLQN